MTVTRFGGIPRGYADRGTSVTAEGQAVAKWGNWHCGEDKARFDGSWTATVPTLFEEFVEGDAVRGKASGLHTAHCPHRFASEFSSPSWSRARPTMKSTRSSTSFAPW